MGSHKIYAWNLKSKKKNPTCFELLKLDVHQTMAATLLKFCSLLEAWTWAWRVTIDGVWELSWLVRVWRWFDGVSLEFLEEIEEGKGGGDGSAMGRKWGAEAMFSKAWGCVSIYKRRLGWIIC